MWMSITNRTDRTNRTEQGARGLISKALSCSLSTVPFQPWRNNPTSFFSICHFSWSFFVSFTTSFNESVFFFFFWLFHFPLGIFPGFFHLIFPLSLIVDFLHLVSRLINRSVSLPPLLIVSTHFSFPPAFPSLSP